MPPWTKRRIMILVAFCVCTCDWPRNLAVSDDENRSAIIAAIEKAGGKVEREYIHGNFKIDFRGSRIGDAGLFGLRNLENVWEIDLRSTQVSDAGLAQLQGRKTLSVLELGPAITDAGLSHLATIPGLRSLDLRETRVSDAGAIHLKKLKRLDHLDMRGTQLTAAGLADIRQALPKVEIRGDDEIPYFPEGIFDNNDREKDDSEAQGLIQHLRPMGESPLWRRDKAHHEATVIRLLWVPSLDHPVAVRIVHADGAVTLHARKLEGFPGAPGAKVGVNKRTKLTEAEWAQLQVYLEQARFWNMPTQPPKPKPNPVFGELVGVTDGDELICEGVADGKYHIVYRLNVPDRNYQRLCSYLLSLSGLDVMKTWQQYHQEDEFEDANK